MSETTSSIIKYRFTHNRNRTFGSALGYVPALIENEIGDMSPALFTADEIKGAIARARANPEDAPKLSWWQSLTREMT